MSWTDERVELLKKLWSDGLSASQIAAELGGITRNAVIGKVHRLKLPQPLGKRVSYRNKRQRQAPQRRTSSNYDFQGKLAIANSEPGLSERLKGEAPDGTGIQIADLTDFNCHWPKVIAAAAERGIRGVSSETLMQMHLDSEEVQ